MKASLVERGSLIPPMTHDIRFLGAQVGAPTSVTADLALLYPVFSISRYPDPSGLPPVDVITEPDAIMHPDAARRVVAWISGQL